MMRKIDLTDVSSLVGTEVGVSDWLVVDQPRIDRFAEATDDRQWIHVDPVQAAAGPFGTTIAHGFLTLSLFPAFAASAFEVTGISMGINYGLGKVRFLQPVPVNSRLRARFALASSETLPNGAVQVVFGMTVEREGAEAPSCFAEVIVRFILSQADKANNV